MIKKIFFCIYFQSEEIFLDMFEDEYQAVRRGKTYACKKIEPVLAVNLNFRGKNYYS